MRQRWKYKNEAEETFCKFIENQGYIPSKRGWPDFICVKDNEVICVEVKRSPRAKLKKEQKFVMEFLRSHGIRCYKWSLNNQRLIENL